MKNVAIHAYPFGNVGDDLFIITLCERYPEVQFHLALHMDFAEALQHVPNLSLYPVDTVLSRLRTWFYKDALFPRALMQKIDATVYIGGSLFMEQVDWEKAFIRMKLLQQLGKPFFIIGANFGPYRSNTFLKTHEDFFKHVTAISFRDDFSYSLFNHLENVRYAPDVIFSLHETLQIKEVSHEKHMLISVIYPSLRKHLAYVDERYFSGLARLVEDATKQGYAITLTAFCPYEKDDQAIAEVLNRVSTDVRKAVHVHVYDGDINEVFHLFQRASIVVATRFHAMILGWLFQKNVFPITYSEKMENVLEDISYDGDFQTIEEVNEHLSAHVYNNQAIKINLRSLAKESENHFNDLDHFLRRE